MKFKNVIKHFRNTVNLGLMPLCGIMALAVVFFSNLPADEYPSPFNFFIKLFLFVIVFFSIYGLASLEETQQRYRITINKQQEEIKYLKKLLMERDCE